MNYTLFCYKAEKNEIYHGNIVDSHLSEFDFFEHLSEDDLVKIITEFKLHREYPKDSWLFFTIPERDDWRDHCESLPDHISQAIKEHVHYEQEKEKEAIIAKKEAQKILDQQQKYDQKEKKEKKEYQQFLKLKKKYKDKL